MPRLLHHISVRYLFNSSVLSMGESGAQFGTYSNPGSP